MTSPADLRIRWSRRERTHRREADGSIRTTPGALVYTGESSTGGMLAHFFEGLRYPGDKTLAEELEARGYDLTTLRFQIRKKVEP